MLGGIWPDEEIDKWYPGRIDLLHSRYKSTSLHSKSPVSSSKTIGFETAADLRPAETSLIVVVKLRMSHRERK